MPEKRAVASTSMSGAAGYKGTICGGESGLSSRGVGVSLGKAGNLGSWSLDGRSGEGAEAANAVKVAMQ